MNNLHQVLIDERKRLTALPESSTSRSEKLAVTNGLKVFRDPKSPVRQALLAEQRKQTSRATPPAAVMKALGILIEFTATVPSTDDSPPPPVQIAAPVATDAQIKDLMVNLLREREAPMSKPELLNLLSHEPLTIVENRVSFILNSSGFFAPIGERRQRKYTLESYE